VIVKVSRQEEWDWSETGVRLEWDWSETGMSLGRAEPTGPPPVAAAEHRVHEEDHEEDESQSDGAEELWRREQDGVSREDRGGA